MIVRARSARLRLLAAFLGGVGFLLAPARAVVTEADMAANLLPRPKKHLP